MMDYEDWGVNREAGGQPGDGGPWAIAGTVSRGLYRRRRGRQIRMVVTPVGGTEASWTLSSTLAPEGRVVLTT